MAVRSAGRLRAVLPRPAQAGSLRISVDDQPPPRHGYGPDTCVGRQRERHQRVHELRVRLAPQPGMQCRPWTCPSPGARDSRAGPASAAGTRPRPCPGNRNAEKRACSPLARLAGLAVTDAVRQHDEVARPHPTACPAPNNSPANSALTRLAPPAASCRAGSGRRYAPRRAHSARATPNVR